MLIKTGRVEFRFNWLIAACILLVFSGLLRLGFWQLERAQDKIDQQMAFRASGEQQATPITEVPVAGPEFDRLQHQNRRVVLNGEYLNERSIFLIYQTWEQQPGFEVVTPLRLAAGDMIVLVSRGWSGINSYEKLAATLPALEGPQTLEGQLFIPTPEQAAQVNAVVHAERWPLLLRYLNMGDIAPHFDTPLFPYVVRLAPDQPGVLIRHWPLVLVDSGRNYSYALQWFAMAVALLLVSLILSSNLLKRMQEPGKPR